jgi:hypothetical protein
VASIHREFLVRLDQPAALSHVSRAIYARPRHIRDRVDGLDVHAADLNPGPNSLNRWQNDLDDRPNGLKRGLDAVRALLESVGRLLESVGAPLESVLDLLESVGEPLESVGRPLECVLLPLEAIFLPLEPVCEVLESVREPLESVCRPSCLVLYSLFLERWEAKRDGIPASLPGRMIDSGRIRWLAPPTSEARAAHRRALREGLVGRFQTSLESPGVVMAPGFFFLGENDALYKVAAFR